ncbi:DNA-binding response regulator [Lyngbya confervoides]|uniref:DNA-binding response regulator n=1 Tax=Lyngbya confervoides BDU141951 TaxID=1574623 RepID=A0ABD4T9A8_9CYAN|nr:DNA-binding response regulator [Lyngbya confervoides]MCM1985389.1 DNA-binding response regulator [Lyngbya confervoides BDU141951]
MQPEQEQEIAKLRALKVAPKQIARKLGLRPAEVSAILQKLSQQTPNSDTDELPPVKECWVNSAAAEHFFGEGNHIEDQTSEDEAFQEGAASSGLAIVVVAREVRFGTFVVCSYLVDYWCLGIKNTLGPKTVNATKYTRFLQHIYEPFEAKPQQISLEQAQAIALGAVDYAQTLGFKPHRDFDQTRKYLGTWDGSLRIEFGKNGKPFYFCGPHDNSRQIMETLRQTVGDGNFDFVTTPF